jgi:hypothetical protein
LGPSTFRIAADVANEGEDKHAGPIASATGRAARIMSTYSVPADKALMEMIRADVKSQAQVALATYWAATHLRAKQLPRRIRKGWNGIVTLV